MSRLLRNTCLLLLLALLLPVLFLAQGPVFTTGQWVADRNLHDARIGACTVTLADGRMLATGGQGSTGALTSAEYLSVAGDLTTVAPMNVARSEHVCAVLPDGRVLAAGGRVAGNAATNAAEIYDPAGNTWTNITSLREARIGAAVTMLADGRVLIAGGEASGAASATLEIYDPGSQSFALVSGAMSAARKNLAAARLADGRVLLAGGSSGSGALATAEIFDPAVGAISPVGSMTSPRTGLSATSLDNGVVLLAGGSNGALDLATSELFDPKTGIFAGGPSMGSPRSGHQAYLIPHNNNVLIAGGMSAGQPLASTEQYAWWTNSFTSLSSVSAARSLMTGGAGLTGFVTVAGGSLGDGTTSAKQDTILLPTVRTDKLDYQPGDTAIITGSGWKANETVGLSIAETPDLDNDSPITLTAMADGAGNFSSTLPIDEADLGTKFVLVATGRTSGLSAETNFTDATHLKTVMVIGAQTPNPVTSGNSVSYGTVATGSVQVDFNGAGSCTANLTVISGLPAGATATFTPTSLTGNNNSQFSLLAISTTAATPAGTSTFTIEARGTGGGGNDCATTENLTTTAKLVVAVPANTAPVVTKPADQSSSEGENHAFSLGSFTDAAGDSPWNITVNWGDASAAETFSTNAPGNLGTRNHIYADGPSTRTVTVSVTDKNGVAGSLTGSAAFTVTVSNVSPTASFGNNGPVNEGSPANVTFTSQSDPSSVDTAAGFHYAYSCTNGDLSAATYAGSGTSATNPCTFNDNGTFDVKARILDKDNGFTEYTTSVTVNNVAPTATLGNSGPIDEGSSATVSFTAPSDPSSADTTAGFHYAFSCTNASLNGATYAGSGSAANTTCTFDDNGTNTVRARILDKDNGFTEYSTDVVVKNVAPTATFTGPASANEGDSKTYTFASQHDPSTADTTAGFHYAYSCTGTSLASATYAASGTAATTNCTFADNGTFTVRARILDKDDGSTEYTVTVTVANVAPTATAPGDQIANEGSTVSFNLGSFSDPGINDNPWTVNVDWGDATPPDSFTTAAQGVITAHSHKFDDGPNSYTVTVTVKDKDLGTSVPVTFKVTVANVAPIATFGNSGPVNEGSPFTLSLSSPSDPSSADTTAGFQYAFDCGSGYGAYGSSNSISCTTNDNGSRAVKGKIKDKDNGETEYTATVVVNNVAPTAVLGNNGPVNEGSPATITFTGALDPSTVDTAAGFHYSYSCLGSLAGSYAAAGASANANCTFPDNGSYVVTGRIFDKDNGFTDYTTTVTVNNVAPTLVAPGNQSSNEGSSVAFNLGMFSDPGVNDNPWHVSVDWGDGPPQTFDTGVQGSVMQNHTYDDGPHSYTVKVTVADKDGGISNQISFSVTVVNIAPIATFGNNGPVNEGSPFMLSLTSPSDPSTADTTAGFQYAFDCGSGYGAYGSSNSISCTTNDNGSRAVKGKIKDRDSGETEYTATVVVNNVAPTANFAGPLTANEGETKPYTFSGATDPSGVDTAAGFRYAYSCDGSAIGIATYAAASTVATVNCTLPDNGSIILRGRILDKDSGYSDYSVAVTVANVAPSNLIVSLTSAAVNENGVAMLNGSFIDPGVLDTHAVMINWGDGSLVTPLNLSAGVVAFSAPHQYLDDSPSGTKFDNYPISVSVMDKDGGSATPAGISIRVNNVPPVIGAGADITVPVTPVAIPALLTISVNVPFTDVGTLDTHTCTIDWDDNGAQTSFPPTESGGNGSCLGTYSHTVASAGVYTIRLMVQDDDTDSVTYTDESLFVAYDPSGGFVTGGGWIDSPLGAYKPNPSLTGKANFGFVSKYQKGANVPTGDTEFQFKSGNLNFKSTSYDWLVVAGSKAQYKGNGTINGAGNYSFLLTAIAGSGNNTDRFRLKIQDGGGGVVYDSAVSGPDDIDNSPTTALAGGSIQVHK